MRGGIPERGGNLIQHSEALAALRRQLDGLDATAEDLEAEARDIRNEKNRMVFGFYRKTGLSYREIAEGLGVSKARVQQLITKGKEQR